MRSAIRQHAEYQYPLVGRCASNVRLIVLIFMHVFSVKASFLFQRNIYSNCWRCITSWVPIISLWLICDHAFLTWKVQCLTSLYNRFVCLSAMLQVTTMSILLCFELYELDVKSVVISRVVLGLRWSLGGISAYSALCHPGFGAYPVAIRALSSLESRRGDPAHNKKPSAHALIEWTRPCARRDLSREAQRTHTHLERNGNTK